MEDNLRSVLLKIDDISSMATARDSILNGFDQVIQSLRSNYIRIQIAEESLSNGKPISKEHQELLTDLQFFEKELELLRELPKERSSSSMDEGWVEESRDHKRHLCVSYDSMVFCLDLNKCMDCSDNKLLPLPKISALKFSKKSKPASMGLFKLGSGAYMVGGHHYKCYRMTRENSRAKVEETRCTYKVTLVDDKLRLSKCKSIGDLKKPKLWPTVVKIGDEIHVFESVPKEWTPPCHPIPSHEVLRLNENSVRAWTEISPEYDLHPCLNHYSIDDDDAFANGYHLRTWFHILIGERIYTSCSLDPAFIGIYDLGQNRWKGNRCRPSSNLYNIKHVGQFLSIGCGICVGKFLETDDHVVVAIGRAGQNSVMEAVAYLVSPTGQVLCYQRLPSFFGGVLQYYGFSRGTMFRVEEEGGTVCAVVEGCLRVLSREVGIAMFRDYTDKEPLEHFLRVSTFTAEEGCGARTLALDKGVYARRKGDEVIIDKLPNAMEKDFVKIVVKEDYAFKLEEVDVVDIDERMSACFL